ncbi:MAG: hypothetical protein ACRDUV_27065, partial [Pseudonocardiaceae bacterium]
GRTTPNSTHTRQRTESPMDATTPSTTDDELDLDVTFVESGLEVAGGDSGDCTDDECKDTRGCD